jgi:hypothetical protein
MPFQFSTGDSTGAALQTAIELQHHFTFIIQGINPGRANKETDPLFTGLAFLRIDLDVPFRIGLDGILGQFCFNI